MRKMHIAIPDVLFALVICLGLSVAAHAQGVYNWTTVEQAPIDECFQGNVNNTGGITTAQENANKASFSGIYSGAAVFNPTACANSGGVPKIDQAYVWGLTEDSSGIIWFGTVANTLCLVLDSYYGTTPSPYQNSDYVCDTQQWPQEDSKPPRVYMYDPSTSTLTDLTPKILASTDGVSPARLTKTIGIRSAGYANGVVFFAGLTSGANSTTPVAVYAFNAATQAYLGSYLFDGSDTNFPYYYNNIRQWHLIDGNLYTGVSKPSGTNYSIGGGAMLRWTGTLANPFSFVEVGELAGGQPAYFVAHSDNRIYATTWGAGGNATGMLVFVSPSLGTSTGPDETNTGVDWTPVWNLTNYEVEPTAVQVGGAIESFGGYLYFGTMQVPETGFTAFRNAYPSVTLTTTTETTVLEDTYRAIAIFRSPGVGSASTLPVELLYGSATLPQYDAATNSWSDVPNNMGVTPTYGDAGFGNIFNNYTWAMAVFQGQLYVGTMDFSYLAQSAPGVPSTVVTYAAGYYGADLWTFTNTTSAATLVSGNGMGNDTSYGIRTMVADDAGGNLWLGMANPMNLRADFSDNPGGWKLIDLSTPAKIGTTTTLTPSATSVFVKNSLTLTAQVTPTTGSGTPTGSVTFMDGSTSLGSVALNSSGQAQLQLSNLTTGSHSITAVYSNDFTYNASNSAVLTETVEDFQFNAGTVTATVLPGGSATFSFTVVPLSGSTFPAPITLTVQGCPANAICNILSSTTIATGNGTTSVSVQVQTNSNTALNRSLPSGLSLAILFLPMAGLFRLRRRARGAGIALLLLGLAAVVGFSGCNQSSSSTTHVAPGYYQLTMQGTADLLEHSITLDLTVQ